MFGHEAVLSMEVTRDHANTELACVAENELSQIPVSSNHRTLGVKSKREIERLFTVYTIFYLKLARVMSTSRDRRNSSMMRRMVRRRSFLAFLTSPILRQISR